jgi:capsular exopolysaccharide synthesis family protein
MQKISFNLYENRNKAVKDAYEMLAANIRISQKNDNKLTTIVLTSFNPKEGKTAIAISLAISLARAGLKVLLIDADMRKPARAKRLNMESYLGLTDYLSDNNAILEEILCETSIPNLTYLACGSEHNNIVGLLCSPRFDDLMSKVTDEFDIVLLDTPALSSVMDGAFIASRADGTILIVKQGATSLSSLQRIKEQLQKLNANILGVVLNKVNKRDYKIYFGAYNYYNTEKFAYSKAAEPQYRESGNQ